MKKYINPAIKCINVDVNTILSGSLGKLNGPDTTTPGGLGRDRFNYYDDFNDFDENLSW